MAYDVLGPANAPGAVTVRPSDGRVVGATDTWFRDCTNDTSNDGTALQAGWLNGMMAELRALLRGNGLTGGGPAVVPELNSDDAMLLKSVQYLIQRGQTNYVVDAGSANAIIVALSPTASEYKAGLRISVKVAANNTGATTINVSGLGTKSVVHVDGSALIKDDIVANQVAVLEYDGTSFQLVSAGAPIARNKMFLTTKQSDQSLSFGAMTDVTFPVTTCAFGTFNGTTFTFGLSGTYLVFSGVYVDATISNGDYIHVGGNFVKNGSTTYGYGDAQIFGPTPNTLALTSWGFLAVEITAGETIKVQASSAATTYWTAGKVRASGQTFLAIVRF